MESDPIGLRGGVSSFGYVFGAPLNFFDDEVTEAKSADKCTAADDIPGGWNFRKCCAKHDECYGCPGKANNTDRPFVTGARGQSTPELCVSDRCRRVKCAGTAKTYCSGVRRFGLFFFQTESCE